MAYGKNISVDSKSGLFPDFASDVELTHMQYNLFYNELSDSVLFEANKDSYFNQFCYSHSYHKSNGDIDYLMLAKCVGVIRDILYLNLEVCDY